MTTGKAGKKNMEKYCFGIDVGGTSIKCGLFQLNGTVADKWEIPTRTENNGEEILPDIAKAIDAKLLERGIEKSSVTGVGIGLPGPVNDAGEIACAVNLYWGFKAVSKELGALTGLPVKVGNDANVAALGEAWKGAAEGHANVVMFTLGTGVGGGIIINGKIHNGVHGAGGEVGHMAMNHEEPESCNCGNNGCLEQYASATGIVRTAKQMLAASEKDSVLRNVDPLTAKDVLDAFKAGDAVAVEIMEKVADILGGALAIVGSVVDPEAFVIGGGVSKAGQPLIDILQKNYNKYTFKACKQTPIVLAKLGNDAGIYGAACMVIAE